MSDDEKDERDYDEITLPENVIPFPRERIVRRKRTASEAVREIRKKVRRLANALLLIADDGD